MRPSKEELKELREMNIELTKVKLEKPLESDKSIIHCIRLMVELEKSGSSIKSRLVNWYSCYDFNVKDVDGIPDDSKGKGDKEFIIGSKDSISCLGRLLDDAKSYLERLMEKSTPNLKRVAGAKLGALLISHAGSLEKLSRMTSSKIQVLGAEKALFRHMRTGSRSPKHGIILMHESVANAENSGKAARILSADISKAARMDFFRDKK